MASEIEYINYKDFVESLPARTTAKSGDKTVVSNSTDGPGSETNAAQAQKVFAGNIAPAFDPTRDENHKYLAGESVAYNGKVYTFKASHYGAWSSSDVFEDDMVKICKKVACDRPFNTSNFCWANINITDSGWTPSESAFGTRLYFDNEHPIHLDAGDVLYVDKDRLKSYTYRLYTGIRINNVYSHIGWSTDLYYYASSPTDIIINFEITDPAIFTGAIIEDFVQAVCVSTKSKNNYSYVVDEIDNLSLRKGTYDFYGSGVKLVYQDSNDRIMPAVGHFVNLKQGDKIVALGFSIWVNKISVLTNTYMPQTTDDTWHKDSFDIADDGVYLFQVKGVSSNVPYDGVYIERSGCKYYPTKYLSHGLARIDPCILHLGYNITITHNQVPLPSFSKRRFCTLPNKPIKVKAGDVLVVNLDSAKTLGVYLQLTKPDGTTVERSWSFLNYVVPSDGDLNVVVEINEGVSTTEYQGILEAAFAIFRNSQFENYSMVSKDEKALLLDGKRKKFAQKEGVAHRGFSSEAPENTLPAFRLASERGFNWVECDVRYTADDVAVIIHDSTIDRTSDGSGAVAELTLAQLRTYDFGSWKSLDYAGTPIPTLEDFLMCCNRLGLNAVIDYSGNGSNLTYARTISLLDSISKCGMNGHVMLMLAGGDKYVFQRLMSYIVSLNAYNLVSVTCLWDEPTDDDKASVKYWRDRGYAVSLSIDQTGVSDELMEFCADNDIPVNVYTVNSTATVETLAEEGCVSWITSDSILAQDYIKTMELNKDCTDL